MNKRCVGLALVAALLGSTVADATVYMSTRTVGTGSATLSITTDGTIGTLTAANIVDWSITIANKGLSTTLLGPLSGGNSSAQVEGNALSASASALSFNFAATGTNWLSFQLSETADSDGVGAFYCLQTTLCYSAGGAGEGLQPGDSLTGLASATRAGTQAIANAAAATAVLAPVPEAATWMMFIGGFGLVGSAQRRRARTIVRFA